MYHHICTYIHTSSYVDTVDTTQRLTHVLITYNNTKAQMHTTNSFTIVFSAGKPRENIEAKQNGW